jgi:hypothetical protein
LVICGLVITKDIIANELGFVTQKNYLDYYYSSAGFYKTGADDFGFLNNISAFNVISIYSVYIYLSLLLSSFSEIILQWKIH